MATPMILVPRERTIVTLDDLLPPFDRRFQAMIGERPEVLDFAFFYGKLCMECGHPGPKQACWCLNVGNLRGTSKRGRYCLLAGAHEYVPKGKIPEGWYEIPNPPGHVQPPGTVAVLPLDIERQKFRAYESIDEAVDEYLEKLRERFNRTFRSLVALGTKPEEVVIAMKMDGYMTGFEVPYAQGVGSIGRANIPRIEAYLQRTAEPGTREILARLDTYGGAVTQIRAGEGVHDIGFDETPLEDPPTFFQRVRRWFGAR